MYKRNRNQKNYNKEIMVHICNAIFCVLHKLPNGNLIFFISCYQLERNMHLCLQNEFQLKLSILHFVRLYGGNWYGTNLPVCAFIK